MNDRSTANHANLFIPIDSCVPHEAKLSLIISTHLLQVNVDLFKEIIRLGQPALAAGIYLLLRVREKRVYDPLRPAVLCSNTYLCL